MTIPNQGLSSLALGGGERKTLGTRLPHLVGEVLRQISGYTELTLSQMPGVCRGGGGGGMGGFGIEG